MIKTSLRKNRISFKTTPNKACSRCVGVCGIFEYFSGLEFFPPPSTISSHPHTANAMPLATWFILKLYIHTNMTQYNQNEQTVNTQFNIGRDQIIQNLVLVGQFLDYAKIENLIEQPSVSENFHSVIDAFEKNIGQNTDSGIAESVAFAGEVLKDLLSTYVSLPQKRFATLPIGNFLKILPEIVFKKFDELNYTNAFAEKIYGEGYILEHIYLDTTSALWLKHFSQERRFFIKRQSASSRRGYPAMSFYDILEYDNKNLPSPMPSREFKVFTMGIVLDLMRFHSLSLDNMKFWKEISSLISSTDKK